MELNCGFNYPIFGDVSDESSLNGCTGQVVQGHEGHMWDETNCAAYGNLLTYNCAMYQNTQDDAYLGDDSDYDYNGTNGRLILEFSPKCTHDIMVRHVMLEFMAVGAGAESCLSDYGCTTSSACNYDPDATIDDGSCVSDNCGCKDPEAYNCDDDIWEAGEDYPNYFSEVGDIVYDNGCNYYNDDWNETQPTTDNCNVAICEGFYNESFAGHDGSCDYWQSPYGDDVVFTVETGSILVDWSNWATFSAPSAIQAMTTTIKFHTIPSKEFRKI